MNYKHPIRKTGSQSETPRIKIHGQDITISGYQNFKINNETISVYNARDKYYDVVSYMEELDKSLTVADLGCSSGLLSLLLHRIGYEAVYAYEHDIEYLNTLAVVLDKLKIENVYPIKYSFGDDIKKHDYVIALALIHWVFSMTAQYGSFKKIFDYFKTICNEYLILEWVDPLDGAIQFLKHTSYNKDIQEEEYNLINFEAAVNDFGVVLNKINVNQTRIIYIIKKH